MKSHCESCGRTDYVTDDGYTACCNEPVCCGGSRDKWGTPDNYVVACCWAKAEEKFEALGKEVPEGSYRL